MAESLTIISKDNVWLSIGVYFVGTKMADCVHCIPQYSAQYFFLFRVPTGPILSKK